MQVEKLDTFRFQHWGNELKRIMRKRTDKLSMLASHFNRTKTYWFECRSWIVYVRHHIPVSHECDVYFLAFKLLWFAQYTFNVQMQILFIWSWAIF